ncbi:hypothetical protein JB92DRAFT_3048247 [Gautieria morchelliformis]|nr:hypothetical protein JB92DRAFT_3048247 [Gautieria morchelliformis]
MKEPMWQLCLAPWESLSLEAAELLLSSLYGSIWSSNCHSPTRCLSYLWHEQGEHYCSSNSVAGAAISGIS